MDDATLNNPFLALHKKQFTPKSPDQAKTEEKRRAAAVNSQEDDEALFLDAMAAVDALPRQQRIATSANDNFAALFADSPPEKAAVLPGRRRAAPAGAGQKPAPNAALAHDGTDDDTAIFAKAMSGVVPVTARGRDLPSPPGPVKPPAPPAGNVLEQLVSGKVEFTLAFTEEYIEGRVKGLNPVIMGMLKAGSYSLEGHLDLHGQNLAQAHAALTLFIKEAYHAGKRHVLLITGRGRNSPGGAPVIRERVQSWLTQEPFKRVILAFATARARDGGAGALYILLRKRKKSQGKIIWDRMPTEEDLLA